ncbi:MAG: DUF1800 domain-containing protein [Betaproteobacteria bacterium]|nr:DUF1800 domain-containing protein [Betaproteobacteria bacterium]
MKLTIYPLLMAGWRVWRSALILLGASFAWFAQPGQAAEAIGADGARHLLVRTGFAASPAEIKAFAALSREQAADRLLQGAKTSVATPPPAWVNEPPTAYRNFQSKSAEEKMALVRQSVAQGLELREWWFREMLTTSSPFTEKMTLFWHNHFATSQQKVRFTPYMYQQNLLLRRHALGSFSALLHDIARDPAMLIYLDGITNRDRQPNENFAREVMELFTLGEGNYSEQDIKEVARAFTGWSLDRETGQFRFYRFFHDGGRKTVLGKSGKWDGDQVLDLLLEQPQAAEFITRKLWKEFVSPTPDEAEVKRLAGIFRGSEYSISKLMRAMLVSDAFYAPENRGSLIKSPVEFVVGTLKTFEIEPPSLRPFVIGSALLGQNVFSPPNVKGWPGGEAWINSSTLLGRRQLLDRLLRNDDRPEMARMAMKEESANREGDSPQGREARQQRQMARMLAAMRWDAQQWLSRFEGTPQELERLVLAMAPSEPVTAKSVEGLRQWVMDPIYQLK